MSTRRGTHLSRLAHPSNHGLLHPRRLWGPKHHPCQTLVGNQPWCPRDRNLLLFPVLKPGDKKKIQGKDQCGCMNITGGMGVRGSRAMNVPRGSLACLGKEVPLLNGMQGVVPPHTHTPAPASASTWRDLQHSKGAPGFCNCLLVFTVTGTWYSSLTTFNLPTWSEKVCPNQLQLSPPLRDTRNRCLRVAHMQKSEPQGLCE